MTLSDLASLGSFISGAAVLVSLVFLYFQLRQVAAQVKLAEKNQQAAIQQARFRWVSDIMLTTTDPALAEAVERGMAGDAGMTKAQFEQFRSWSAARFHVAEDTFLQYRHGLLSEDAFASFIHIYGGAASTPGFRAIWKLQRNTVSAEFAAFTDKLIAERPAVAPLDAFAVWNAELAAVKSAGVLAATERAAIRSQAY